MYFMYSSPIMAFAYKIQEIEEMLYKGIENQPCQHMPTKNAVII